MRNPATTRIWKDRKAAIWESVTISVVDQPASSSACSAADVGVARVEDEQVHVLEGRGEARTQHAAGLLAHAIDRPGRILAAQRTRWVAAVGALRPGFRDGCVNRFAQRRRGSAGGKARGVEIRDRRPAMQAGDEAAHREALLCRDVARDLRREQRAVARLRVGARLRPTGTDRVQGRSRRNPDQRVDHVGVCARHSHRLLVVTRRAGFPQRHPAPSRAREPPPRRPARSIAG